MVSFGAWMAAVLIFSFGNNHSYPIVGYSIFVTVSLILSAIFWTWSMKNGH
jgi:hypothetical protein